MLELLASFMLLLSSALGPHRTMVGAPDLRSASLHHALWVHSPARADDWLNYDQDSSRATGGPHALPRPRPGRLRRLVPTVAQEGMIRPTTPR